MFLRYNMPLSINGTCHKAQIRAPMNTPFFTSNFFINLGSIQALQPISSKKASSDTTMTPVIALTSILKTRSPGVNIPQPRLLGALYSPSLFALNQVCQGKVPAFKKAIKGRQTICINNGIKKSAGRSHFIGNRFQPGSSVGALKT